MYEGQTTEEVRIAPSRVPRLVALTTNGLGSTVWRLPLATTVNDLPLTEGALLYGGLGAATAITLFTFAHAAIFAGSKTRRKRDASSLAEAARDDPGLAVRLEGMYANGGEWCSLRLRCELAARAEADLDPQEKTLLSFFRGEALADDLLVPVPPRGWPAQCRHQARRCPYSARTMMETFRAAHAGLERDAATRLRPSC
ncbi:uncharacterized protein LOC127009288 [Eriocheir sinensis]|uniref:uncharacterized protein LOC127009288 n=1 Tax=Eriocheir sinensis TaxID=95602 RepID=UPI0021C99A61|nr:uncharacterized protein LOC127009288 [Eriocheir sinensis]